MTTINLYWATADGSMGYVVAAASESECKRLILAFERLTDSDQKFTSWTFLEVGHSRLEPQVQFSVALTAQ